MRILGRRRVLIFVDYQPLALHALAMAPPLSMWGEGIIKGKLPRTLSPPLAECFEEEDGGGDGDV